MAHAVCVSALCWTGVSRAPCPGKPASTSSPGRVGKEGEKPQSVVLLCPRGEKGSNKSRALSRNEGNLYECPNPREAFQAAITVHQTSGNKKTKHRSPRSSFSYFHCLQNCLAQARQNLLSNDSHLPALLHRLPGHL